MVRCTGNLLEWISSGMKYKHIAAYKINGLTHVPDKGDVEIYVDDNALPVRAILTERVDDYCYELDCAQALGNLLLKTMVGQRGSDDLTVAVEAEVSRIREQRNRDIGRSEVLIFIAEGEVEPDFSGPTRETDNFTLAFGAINKKDIAASHSAQLNAALVALLLSTEHETAEVKRMKRDTYLISESGKPIYSIDLRASASVSVSKRTSDRVIEQARHQVATLTGDRSLIRVNELLVQAISSHNGKLRRFICGWSALEIFVSKVFRKYEKALFNTILAETTPVSDIRRTLKRIRAVMSDKYSITDKFSVIAACLGDDSVDTDVETFALIKDSRDKLFHREALDDDSLPLAETIQLLKKYIRLHISTKAVQ